MQLRTSTKATDYINMRRIQWKRRINESKTKTLHLRKLLKSAVREGLTRWKLKRTRYIRTCTSSHLLRNHTMWHDNLHFWSMFFILILTFLATRVCTAGLKFCTNARDTHVHRPMHGFRDRAFQDGGRLRYTNFTPCQDLFRCSFSAVQHLNG